MGIDALAQNLKRLRVANRLSQKSLAEASGISLPTLKNIENVKTTPRVDTVQSLAHALGVGLQDLFLSVKPLEAIRFRSKKRMQNRENILADVALWLRDFDDLETLLGEKPKLRLDHLSSGSPSKKQVLDLASKCRKALNLDPKEPIYDICGLLERAGVKVYPLSTASEGFFGLSVGKEDGGPAIVVNNWERISIERRIFSAANELGHLMLHPDAYDVSKEQESKKEEAEASLFAGHFLMPDEGFICEWDRAAGLHFMDRVFKVKRIFRVSYKSALFRLKDLGRADDSIWQTFNFAYQRRFKRKLRFEEEPLGIRCSEPQGLREIDFSESRFRRLVRKAIEEEKISLSRGAEILRIGIEDMRELLKDWECGG